MSGWSRFALIEGVLVFGLVTSWGLLELRGLKREARKREEREARERGGREAREREGREAQARRERAAAPAQPGTAQD